MSDFLGARISLISKSDIRYVGTLYEINSNESTVSLENVRSHGSEGRKGDPSEEVSASDQVYDFIVFRGSDVKDLRIEEAPAAPKENQPPMPNDPAIVGGARAHPGRAPGANQPPGPNGPPGPPGAPGFQNPGMFPPYPPPQGWGRPGPGPPGPGGFGMGYPPQGWFPPGQAFPPNGPGPWNNYPYPPGAPGGPPGPPGMQQQGQQQQRQTPGMSPNAMPSQADKPTPIGGAADLSRGPGPAPVEMPSDSRVLSQVPSSTGPAPTPPVASKPSAEEVKVTAALLENQKPGAPSAPGRQIPTGPKGLTKITPAVPLPAALTARSTQSTVTASANVNNTSSAAALKDATEAARAAVAVAMAKLEQPGGFAGPAAFPSNGNSVDNLTNKVNEMRVSSARSGVQNGRGRGRGGARHTKVEVPDSDFDFATANAKFNKEDVVKERIAGSPITETPVDPAADGPAAAGEPKEVYDKAKSFFDNISSEAKDRKVNNGQRPGGREWRAEEQHRNIETFGQGSVDGGYRGYRGRGRGRGGRGRGYGGRGRGAYRGGRSDGQTIPQ